MTPTVTLHLADGVQVVVPDSAQLITPYVLEEQGDWFEDEIRFLRRLLQPRQQVIDIGANYGVYTLSMAKSVGPSGRVWAYEPVSGTAKLLGESIAANGFTQVLLERAALSGACGEGRISTGEHAELNELVQGGAQAGASEAVTLLTLDACMARHGWRGIDLLKLDAEGEEANILQGGAAFFAQCSPLVQYEVRSRRRPEGELLGLFAALGYASFRLVSSLDLLVAVEPQAPLDSYAVNLFACKPDRAVTLAESGFLLAAGRPTAKFDFQGSEMERALALYDLSRDPARPKGERFDALAAAFVLLRNLCEREPSATRLVSLARVARDYGARAVAVHALQQVCNGLLGGNEARFDEPFLAPGARFDTVPRGDKPGRWLLAAAMEEYELLSSFSSFYAGASARKRLELIRGLGFAGPEMERRLHLLDKRFGAKP